MRRLWTEPVVDFAGKWVKFETCRLDPKPIQKPHVPIIVGGYADAAFRRAVRFGAGWYGFNRDPAGTQADAHASMRRSPKPDAHAVKSVRDHRYATHVDADRRHAGIRGGGCGPFGGEPWKPAARAR